ncbi:zinc finger protein 716-like [Venturia canescens]|uniref:zinc finger protein 716-like n=1 Tax=Venturia canescens TaxID=32260 RepID=UPI001C9BEE2A|nr:zinc finger protein 716-like [Venturia canescens]
MRLSHPLHSSFLPPGICYTCDVCGKTLSTKLTLKRHKEQQHFQPLNSALCILCNKVFRTLNSLNNHKSIYHRTGNGMHPPTTPPAAVYRMPPPTAGGINEPQECPYCRRSFSCYYSLKRHFQDKHEQSNTLYVCEFCNRRYRTKNSLTTHKSLQHRGSSGMLKRLLKTSAIKNVLAQHPHIQQQPQ